ncbi:hypothetical protein ACQJBY_031052 [Aegilops geniculata]
MEMVSGMPFIDHVDRVCDGCLVGKQHRRPFPAQSTYRASDALELLHGDLCGPITPAIHGGKKYFFLVVDDYSRYIWVVLLRSKDEAFEAFKKLKAATEMEHKLKVRALRIDRGGEFTSNKFNDYCEKIGLKRFFTAPYMPQQNGVVERRNRTVVDMARSLLKSKNLPGTFWGEAVSTAVYLLNRAPTKAVIGEDVQVVGKTPNQGDHNGSDHHGADTNDDAHWSQGESDYDAQDTGRDLGNDIDNEAHSDDDNQDDGHDHDDYADDADANDPASTTPETQPSSSSASTPTLFVSPPSQATTDSSGPRRYKTLKKVYKYTKPVMLEYSDLCLLGVEEPANFVEASKSSSWMHAMDEEMKAIESNGTWTLVNDLRTKRP